MKIKERVKKNWRKRRCQPWGRKRTPKIYSPMIYFPITNKPLNGRRQECGLVVCGSPHWCRYISHSQNNHHCWLLHSQTSKHDRYNNLITLQGFSLSPTPSRHPLKLLPSTYPEDKNGWYTATQVERLPSVKLLNELRPFSSRNKSARSTKSYLNISQEWRKEIA